MLRQPASGLRAVDLCRDVHVHVLQRLGGHQRPSFADLPSVGCAQFLRQELAGVKTLRPCLRAPRRGYLRGMRNLLSAALVACAASQTPAPAPPPGQPHLADLRRLTSGGQNAEAYWSFDGTQLSFQARAVGEACDRIFRMKSDGSGKVPVSSGKGATTCAHFLPGGDELIWASTHLGGEACPPRPDRRQGYVWAIYDSYDIFKARADGSELRRLTETPGYDAEGTVCSRDGSIVFTSVRDGDLELYRMDKDGKNVKRLTEAPGYDGGAFFNADCSKIVWRASRPKPGKDLDDYKSLLAQKLVRPTKLELYVANADGTEPMQITYLDAASFAPFWHPSQKRILFASNYGDPKGREFDIWAVDINGTNLERITFAKGFDGFPMFSPDGQSLAFSSNRATAPGAHDTNLFVARWVDSPPKRVVELPADRILSDIRWLADPAREGRGVGTPGLVASGEYLEKRYRELGLAPAGEGGGYRQPFSVTTGLKIADKTHFQLGTSLVPHESMSPLAFSANGSVQADLVLVGYGISDKDLGVDEYDKRDVKGKIAVVRRFVPHGDKFEKREVERRFGARDYKAWVAREKGAKALIVVDAPPKPKDAPKDWKAPDEAAFPALYPRGYGDAGIPVIIVKRSVMEGAIAKLSQKQKVRGEVEVSLEPTKQEAFNVLARLTSGAPASERLPGVVVLGAHYDHLGMGGRDSLAPDKNEPHVGADDNASGTAALLEAARALASRKGELRRDVVFASFSGEESGVLGSSYYTRSPSAGLAMGDVVAMINMDMVGRLRENRATVLGAGTAEEWDSLVKPACERARIDCATSGDGYGPSDQTAF